MTQQEIWHRLRGLLGPHLDGYGKARELAAEAGISEGQLSKYRHGRALPPIEVMQRLAATVGWKIPLELVPEQDPSAKMLELARKVQTLPDEQRDMVEALIELGPALRGEQVYTLKQLLLAWGQRQH